MSVMGVPMGRPGTHQWQMGGTITHQWAESYFQWADLELTNGRSYNSSVGGAITHQWEEL